MLSRLAQTILLLLRAHHAMIHIMVMVGERRTVEWRAGGRGGGEVVDVAGKYEYVAIIWRTWREERC